MRLPQPPLTYASSAPGSPMLHDSICDDGREPIARSSWVPDDACTACPQCNRSFNMLLRRHHCRWCGGVFCADCTPHTLPWMQLKLRACEDCFQGKGNDNNTLTVCPVCSISLRNTADKRQHVAECVTVKGSQVKGCSYTVSILDRALDQQECDICLTGFNIGDKLAVLNCLCKFHESCIQEWFDRGHLCPFHM